MTEPDPPAPQACDWPLVTSGVPGWADADPGQQDTAKAVATYVMWALSGRRLGLCQVTARPCRAPLPAEPLGRAGYAWSGPWAYPYLSGGRWFNANCGCRDGCGCTARTLHLPGPVADVIEVRIDGAVVPSGEYRLIDGASLLRDAGWPTTQNLALDDTEVGTWAVTYNRGVAVPQAGQYAAGILAGEVLKAIRRIDNCRLPARAQSVSRQGVDIQLLDAQAFLEGGRTGLVEVDLFLAAANPNKQHAAPIVWSPDVDTVHLFGGTP